MKESITRTLIVALVVCLFCALFVSIAAISLRAKQKANASLEKEYNILVSAGLIDASIPDAKKQVPEKMELIKPLLVDLDTGEILLDNEAKQFGIDIDTYDQRAAEKDPQFSSRLSSEEDIAKIKTREKFAKIYVMENANDGSIEKLILPIRGYGLWSTLRGFLALDSDLDTIAGLGFFEHAETPGLGGEVDNPKWKAQWIGKKIHDANGKIAIQLSKNVDPSSPSFVNTVDALSGASLTSRGVNNLLHFWLTEKGFGALLTNLSQKS